MRMRAKCVIDLQQAKHGATCMNEKILVGAALTFNKRQYDRVFESSRFTNLASESSQLVDLDSRGNKVGATIRSEFSFREQGI